MLRSLKHASFRPADQSPVGCLPAGASTMISTTRLPPPRRWLAAVLLACILLPMPWNGVQLFAAGQGLDVSGTSLGAGALATATEFERFEDTLGLATTGGRGRSGRGTGNLGGYGSEKEMAVLQVITSREVLDTHRRRALAKKRCCCCCWLQCGWAVQRFWDQLMFTTTISPTTIKHITHDISQYKQCYCVLYWLSLLLLSLEVTHGHVPMYMQYMFGTYSSIQSRMASWLTYSIS